jgi:hypothetical protein
VLRTCIVNFSDVNFKTGQDRLLKSLGDVNYYGDKLFFNNHNQLGCKSQQEVPYQFKVYAIMEAYRKGYDIILYCDASLWAIKDISECLRHIEKHGHLMEYCGYTLGQYCTDIALNEFGITRDEACNIQLHSAGFTGLYLKNPVTLDFLNRWYTYAVNETTFKGGWNNNDKQCSEDDRCLGHRHDQSVASFIAHKLGMVRTEPKFMQYKFDNVPVLNTTFFLAQGIL